MNGEEIGHRGGREMFANLPADELDLDEEIEAIKTTSDGSVDMIVTTRAAYKLVDGVTFRYRKLESGEEVIAWRGGREVGRWRGPGPFAADLN